MKQQFLIAVVALLTAITGHAAGDVVAGGVTYEWSPRELGYIVTGWDEETPIQSLHILGEVDGLDVVGIATGAFEDNEDIVYLTIDEGILYIGENAFCRCVNLEVAVLPEGLVTIQEEAFAFCSKLTTMTIPSTVEDIQAHAFSGCTGVTDVYFLMDETQLEYFNWWDGVYPTAGQEEHGGLEFNESRLEGHNPESGTRIHVPEGMYDACYDSGKFEAWLIEEDSGCYPLWWIVNYGVVGRTYTVCDDLQAVYTDIEGDLYVKDDNRWLTPDRVYSGEVDYIAMTGLMNERAGRYDQSNWAVLSGLTNPASFNGHMIQGASVTGRLVSKKNPVIEVESSPSRGEQANYVPNVYIPCSFMGRTQTGTITPRTFAFVQPKPQEYISVEWAVYCESDDENEFYFSEPDLEQGVNQHGLYGGFMVNYDLYEVQPIPVLEHGGYYAFMAINRLDGDQESRVAHGRLNDTYIPFVDGGLSTAFTVYPLQLPDEPIYTGIKTVVTDPTAADAGWYAIDGRYLGTQQPEQRGVYIHNGKKLVIVK